MYFSLTNTLLYQVYYTVWYFTTYIAKDQRQNAYFKYILVFLKSVVAYGEH